MVRVWGSEDSFVVQLALPTPCMGLHAGAFTQEEVA